MAATVGRIRRRDDRAIHRPTARGRHDLTLREKLDRALSQQQGEVDRLTNVAKEDLPRAQATLTQLQQLSDMLEKNPTVEQGYAALKTLGIKLDTE